MLTERPANSSAATHATLSPVRGMSRRQLLGALAATASLAGGTCWPGRISTPAIAAPRPPAATQDPAADTGWRSFRGSPDQRGLARGTLAANPALRWEFSSPDGWVGCAAIADGKVFAPALAGFLHCLDLQTGKELWKYRSIEDPDPKKFAPGFKAAPFISGNTVYAGDEDGVLHALDRTTGKKLWHFTTGSEIAGCVARYKDHLLLASHDSCLYCLSETGTEIWKVQTNDRINCSPAVADHYTFVAGCDEHLRVIDLETGKEIRDMPLESFLIASPAIVDNLLYVGTHTGLILCVDWRQGQIVWKYPGPREMPFHASAVVTDQLVIVGGHDKTVHAVARDSGKPVWTFATRAKIECSGVAIDNRYFTGSGDGNLYGLDLQTGKEIWKFNAGKDITAGLAVGEGALIASEDQQNGRLLCFS
ncbi:MAG: PQQ-binding-like beta-propeller repeat protein [Planctomyces sp.]|nr:PQQ-binding-like beta-propeller repeat protein [Planctomyces sp.]